MVKKSTYVLLAVLVAVFLLLIADPSQGTETVYLCTKMTCTDSDITLVYTADYDTNGNIISMTRTRTPTRGKQSWEAYQFSYDDQNNVISEIGYSSDDEEMYRRYYVPGSYETKIVTKSSSKVQRTPIDAYGNSADSETVLRIYNNSGKLLSEKIYALAGNQLLSETNNTYDIFGNLLTSITHENGEETVRSEYTYDALGKLLTRTVYYDREETYLFKYSYDPNQNQTIMERYEGENHTGSSVKTYDTMGTLLAVDEIWAYPEDLFSIYTAYEYDSAGNLIKKRYSSRNTEITEYTYVAIRVPADQAKKIREMQTEVFRNQPE